MCNFCSFLLFLDEVNTLVGCFFSLAAVVGGEIADYHNYRYTFLITAGFFAFGMLIYLPLLFIVPRRALDCGELNRKLL